MEHTEIASTEGPRLALYLSPQDAAQLLTDLKPGLVDTDAYSRLYSLLHDFVRDYG